MLTSRYWLLVLAVVAGVACGRALHAEDGCGCAEVVELAGTVDASYVIDDGYGPDGVKTVYGPEEVRYQYIPSRFCDAPAFEPTHQIVIENPNDYGRWGRGVYPHRYDTGMGLGGTPGSTMRGHPFVYGRGVLDAETQEPVGRSATGGSMDAGIGSSPGSGASGPGAGIAH